MVKEISDCSTLLGRTFMCHSCGKKIGPVAAGGSSHAPTCTRRKRGKNRSARERLAKKLGMRLVANRMKYRRRKPKQ